MERRAFFARVAAAIAVLPVVRWFVPESERYVVSYHRRDVHGGGSWEYVERPATPEEVRTGSINLNAGDFGSAKKPPLIDDLAITHAGTGKPRATWGIG